MIFPELFFGGNESLLDGERGSSWSDDTVKESSEDEEIFVSNDLCSCFAKCDCPSSTMFLVVFCVYLALAMISNLIGLYKFIVAWNLIIDQQHIDLPEFYKRRRRMTYKDALKLQLVPKGIARLRCCIICLAEFDENEIVISCSDGCKNWFHKECLFEWLDRSENCPCCRKDMLSRKTRGFFADLSACMGFAPRAR